MNKLPYPPEFDWPDEDGYVLTIGGFCSAIGISPLGSCLRAIDRHNIEHVWLVLEDGRYLYYWSDRLNDYHEDLRVVAIGVGAIAWDGSDWEFAEEVSATDPEWEDLLRCVREEDLNSALAEWDALNEDEGDA